MSFAKPRAPALALFALAACSAHAQEFRPGLWEMTGSNLPKPQTFCFTPDMKKDAKTEMQKHGADCKKGDETVSGDTVVYWVTCTTPIRQASRVTVTSHAPDHFTMATDFSVETPQRGTVTGKSSLTYRRVGECN
jgi:hypothetical protein